ncbi:MAG: hypothetical protein MUO76_00860 [Anaerolineaceae bacterium]|nr:hypothetical protein [Anaerolineaceae bacterium]
MKGLEVFMVSGLIKPVTESIVEPIASPIQSFVGSSMGEPFFGQETSEGLDEDQDVVQVDFQALAEEIYRLLKRELMLENERRGL